MSEDFTSSNKEEFEKSLNDLDADMTVKKLREEANRIRKDLNLASVLILVTRTEIGDDGDEQSRRLNANSGNVYASMGCAQAWLDAE